MGADWTAIVYVALVFPSSAVTFTSMLCVDFDGSSAIGALGRPGCVATLLTESIVCAAVGVAVTVTDVTPAASLTM